MKCFAIVGSAVTFFGLLAAHSVLADGLTLPSDLPEFLLHNSQGYLGVFLGDGKDPHAAEIVMLDHDAPASKSGLKIHDEIVQLDGKSFDNVEQLRHQLRDMPSGRTITLLINRDGSRLNVTVQLCDRKLLEQQAWSQHFSIPHPSGESFLGGAPARGTAFIDSMIPKALTMGADVNPVRTQLAGYFGVKSGTGLLVENVDSRSPAEQAGLKAGDVVVKVESQPMTRKNDWAKAMRSHRGKLVQITVMRNKQEQILTMSDKAKKN